MILNNRKGEVMEKVKKIMVVIVGLVLMPGFLLAEPITMEQATIINNPEEIEVGIDFNYAYDKWTIEGVTGERTRSDLSIPLLFRYTYDESTESKVIIPYRILKGTTIGLSDNSVKGLGTIVVSGKGSFSNDAKKDFISSGLIIDLEIPTGGATKVLREGGNISEGFNVGFTIAMDKTLSESFISRFNFGYKYRGKYTNVNDAKISPSGVLFSGVEGELSLSDFFTALCEIKGMSFGNYKLGDIEQTGTGGSTWDIIPALRFQSENIKAKFGIDFNIGEATYRPYSYKIIAGISYVFK